MKKIFILMLFVCICTLGIAQQNKQLKDGLYLVDKVLHDTNTANLKTNQALVHFNRAFIESAPDSSTGLLVNTADFVPLILGEDPLLLQQTETKKKLQLTFSRLAAEKLEHFTAANVMKQATMIVNGEALTVNKIREAIHGGKMEITGCSDNACQRIYVTLKNHNVEKDK
jgi:preprotein translocase subunit SecD